MTCHAGMRAAQPRGPTRRGGVVRRVKSQVRMRTFVTLALLAACSRTADPPKKGAFEPADVVSTTSDEARIAVERSAVPLEQMAMGRWLAGLPMRGLANIKIDLAAPIRDGRTLFSRAHGGFALTCDKDCRVGDDVAQLVLRGHSVDVGHVDLDSFALRGTVEHGHAKLTQWRLVSPDVKLAVDLDIVLADDLAASTVEGCIRFAPIEGLDKRRPKTWAVIQTTGASLDQAGMFSIRITGTLGAPKRLAQPCEAAAVTMN